MPPGGTAPGRQTAKARLTAARDRSADGADAETAPTVPGGTAATHRPKRRPARVPLPRKTAAMRVRIAAIHPSRVIRPRRAVSNPVPADPIGEDAGTAVRESVRTEAAGIPRLSEAGTLLRPATVRQSAGRLRAETAVRGSARTAAAIPSRSPECRAVRRESRTGPPSELRHRAPAGICRISDRAGAAAPVRMRET